MSTLAQIADKNNKCGAAAAETGTLGCQIEFGTPLHAIAVRKGTVIPANTVFDKTYIDTQTQLGIFIPMIGADSFEEQSSEDSVTTNTRGVERLSTLGLPKYALTFQQGHHFFKELAKLTTFKSLDFIFGDENGNWKMAVNSAGDFTGFSAGQVLAKITKTKVQGGDPESKTVTVQMLNRDQWDINYAVLERNQLDFSPEEIDGINAVEITIGPLAAAGTSLAFTMMLAADRNTPIEGMLIADLKFYADGVAFVPSAIAPGTNGAYTATITAQTVGKKITMSTWDSLTGTTAILKTGVLYRGSSNEVTVTA